MRRRSPAAEPLEPRRLFAAAPLVLTGGGGANTFYLRENADHQHLDVWQNAATAGAGAPTQSPLLSQVSTVAVVGAGTGNAVSLDFANGDPFASSVAVTGGGGAGNTLVVTGLSAAAVQVNATTVTVGSTPVGYAGLQSIAVDGGAGNDTLTQTAQPLAPVVFAGGGGADTLNVNAGTFALAGDPAGATSNLTVNDAGWLSFTAAAAGAGVNARHLAALNVTAGGTAIVDAPPSAADRAVLVVGSLAIAATGRVDLTGNDMVVRGGSLSAVSAAVDKGFNVGGALWRGAGGITSSLAAGDATHLAALGVLANALLGTSTSIYPSFDGQPVASADVLVKYTIFGDANLDGTVNAADYTRIDGGFIKSLTGWSNGDFNGDGTVDGSDYSIIDTAFNTEPVAPTPALVEQLNNALDVAAQQVRKTVAAIGTTSNYPRSVNADGSWSWVTPSDWTAGTWPALLWQLYQATGDAYYKTEATAFTLPLQADENDTGDTGFKIYDSFDPLLQLSPGNATYTNIMLAAAAAKATTYNATVGAFKAWYGGDGSNPAANFDVLTDYMMDSQLLFWAAAQSGNETYYNEAVSNAVKTEQYSVRADGSTAQFSFFNPTTGQFADNQTYQGYSADSTWSRGQAWSIYGFTQCYVATGRADFLATAEKTANWYLAHLPADDVPYWDFNAPTIPNAPRDTSAAAVAASGLLRLSSAIATSDPTNSARYRSAAAQMLAALSSPAYLNSATAPGDGVLLHAALNVPTGITDNSVTYGDYFYVEAINQYLATT